MIRNAKFIFSFHLRFLLCAVVFFAAGCQKEPEWSPEMRKFLETTNHDLEEIAPHFTPDSTPAIVIVGLTRLDKAMDRIVTDLRSFFKKYPFLLNDPKPIGLRYGTELQRLQKNARSLVKDGTYWYERLNKQKDYDTLVKSIMKKIHEADKLTRQPN